MVYIHRPQGCIFLCSNLAPAQTVPPLCIPRRVLPFGLSLSPRVFTRVVMAALAPLQSQGMKVLPYLDDWLICAPSHAQVAQHTSRLLLHVGKLGLNVNLEKSCLTPSQSTTFIGVSLDTTSMLARPSPSRISDILLLLCQFRLGRLMSYVMFLRLLGNLASISRVVPFGLLNLRPFQRWLIGFHLDAKLHRLRKLRVSWRCLCALAPWRNNGYMLRGFPLGVVVSRREVVTTDACPTGWGALWQQRAAQGQWSAQERSHHINVLEFRAVHLALMYFLPYLRGRHVLIQSDNTTIVYHVNHQGGTRLAELLKATQDLLLWASSRLSSLRAMYGYRVKEPGCRFPLSSWLSSRGVAPSPRGCGGDMGPLWSSRSRPFSQSGHSALSSVVFPDRVGVPGPGRSCSPLASL